MAFSIHCIELEIDLTIDEFETLLDRALQKSKKTIEIDIGYADESPLSEGIGIVYRCNKQKKKIKLMVFPGLVIDDDDSLELWKPTGSNISRLLGKLSKRISKYFHSEYKLDDFSLTRVDIVTDMNIGSREKVSDYIKVLRRISKVKRFSPIKCNNNDGIINKDHCFALKGNTNGIEFWIYEPRHMKGTLRAEVRLVKKDTIFAYANEYAASDQILSLAEKSEHVFMDTFRYIVPRGDYFKKPEAEKLIRERVPEKKLRYRMLHLLTLITEKKSLHLAQKSMNCGHFKELMAKFDEIGVSPVTISKRQGVKRLGCLYSYLE